MSEVIVTTATELEKFLDAAVDRAVSKVTQKRQLPILMTLKRTADELGVSYSTVYRASKIRGFPVNHDFGHAMVVSDQLLEWIKSRSNYDLVYNFGS
ncbi:MULTISPECIES: helix-turn-helix transcriptional regulator [Sporosarcina]|uniref:DNA-binding transcriptional regulator AlpA n=1 Tax=Sporosarcina psychrophila TaxID=1476 RepID=A0ABV2KB61_SPOPS|nr:hypothetical protein [Sporosarcina sp. resist]QNK86474.1 hypothetical protein H7992_14520 [Sporosarcina sp. resist]